MYTIVTFTAVLGALHHVHAVVMTNRAELQVNKAQTEGQPPSCSRWCKGSAKFMQRSCGQADCRGCDKCMELAAKAKKEKEDAAWAALGLSGVAPTEAELKSVLPQSVLLANVNQLSKCATWCKKVFERWESSDICRGNPMCGGCTECVGQPSVTELLEKHEEPKAASELPSAEEKTSDAAVSEPKSQEEVSLTQVSKVVSAAELSQESSEEAVVQVSDQKEVADEQTPKEDQTLNLNKKTVGKKAELLRKYSSADAAEVDKVQAGVAVTVFTSAKDRKQKESHAGSGATKKHSATTDPVTKEEIVAASQRSLNSIDSKFRGFFFETGADTMAH